MPSGLGREEGQQAAASHTRTAHTHTRTQKHTLFPSVGVAIKLVTFRVRA